MSTNTADPIQSNGQDASSSIASKFDSFLDTVTSTFEELGATEDQLKIVEDMGHELGEEISSSIKDNAADIDQERERRSAEVEGVHNRINRVSDDIEAVEDDSDDDHPTPSKGETSPLERICRLDESVVDRELTSNQRRARFVAKDIADYSQKVPAGSAIRSSEIRRVLSAGESATIYSQTTSRVMDFLDRFGGDLVSIKETQSGERTVVFDEKIVQRLDEITSGVATRKEVGVTKATT